MSFLVCWSRFLIIAAVWQMSQGCYQQSTELSVPVIQHNFSRYGWMHLLTPYMLLLCVVHVIFFFPLRDNQPLPAGRITSDASVSCYITVVISYFHLHCLTFSMFFLKYNYWSQNHKYCKKEWMNTSPICFSHIQWSLGRNYISSFQYIISYRILLNTVCEWNGCFSRLSSSIFIP